MTNPNDEIAALADEYEAGTNKALASGYEEYGPDFKRKRQIVIDALRLYARLSATSPGDAVREALETIAKGETQVFDDDLKRNVIVSMDEDEMKDIARRALLPLPPLNETGEYHRIYTKEEYDWLNLKGWHQVCHDFRGEEGMTAIRYSSALAPAEKAGDGTSIRRTVLDLLNGVAPAVENLACYQEQADIHGTTVKVSRQALDEVLNAINEVAIQSAISATPTPPSADVEKRGIYIASKTVHADRWRLLRDKIGEPIISTWIDEAAPGQSVDLNDLWQRCLLEASSCKVLIAYRERDEVFKGAWVEIGAALVAGVPVFAVGLDEYTIAKYRGITHFPDMKSAIAASRKLIQSAAPGGGTESDGEVDGHLRSDGSPKIADVRERAGIKPGPSDPAQEPETVAWTHSNFRQVLQRCGVMSAYSFKHKREDDIPLFTRPVSLDREAVFQAVFENASVNMTEDAIERQTERITDAILALIEGRT